MRNTAIANVTANSMADEIYIANNEQMRNFIAKTGGTQLPAGKSDIDEAIEWGYDGYLLSKTVTMDGSLSYNLFTVSGLVYIYLFALVGSDVTDVGDNVTVGIPSLTNRFMTAITATSLDAGEVWISGTSTLGYGPIPANYWRIIHENILMYSTVNVIGGQITFYCFWKPISSGATVTVAP